MVEKETKLHQAIPWSSSKRDQNNAFVNTSLTFQQWPPQKLMQLVGINL